jgi:hypothetical protein
MKSLFYCCVSCRPSSGGSKSVYALHLWMSELDYDVESDVECPDNDPNDVAFVRATSTIRGHDAVEEYVACKMYQLVVGFNFESVALGTTPILRVETPLPLFAVGTIAVEHADSVLAEIRAERIRCPRNGKYLERWSFEPSS